MFIVMKLASSVVSSSGANLLKEASGSEVRDSFMIEVFGRD